MRHYRHAFDARTLAAVALLVAAWLAAAPVAAADMVTEVLPIGYRTAAELVAILRPLVPPPGGVSGIGDKLVVRTTPENLAEIRKVLAEVDRAPANLLISVRHSVDADVRRDLAQAYARVRAGNATLSAGGDGGGRRGAAARVGAGGAEAGARVYSSRSVTEDRDVQRVRALEGREAFIATGESVPIADQSVIVTGPGATVQQGVRYRDVTKGFWVRARLTGDGVTVEVFPHRDTASERGGGAIEVRSAATTVSGPLGHWMEIGGSSEEASTSGSAIVRTTRSRSASDYAIYLKVERLD